MSTPKFGGSFQLNFVHSMHRNTRTIESFRMNFECSVRDNIRNVFHITSTVYKMYPQFRISVSSSVELFFFFFTI